MLPDTAYVVVMPPPSTVNGAEADTTKKKICTAVSRRRASPPCPEAVCNPIYAPRIRARNAADRTAPNGSPQGCQKFGNSREMLRRGHSLGYRYGGGGCTFVQE